MIPQAHKQPTGSLCRDNWSALLATLMLGKPELSQEHQTLSTSVNYIFTGIEQPINQRGGSRSA